MWGNVSKKKKGKETFAGKWGPLAYKRETLGRDGVKRGCT